MPTADWSPESPRLRALQGAAERAGRQVVVGAVIVNPRGQAFVHRRAPHRRLFPGCWDIAGGHVEAGETLHAALAREIREETGWRLRAIIDLVEVSDWATEWEGRRTERREFDFLVAVDGDLARPRLEAEKVRTCDGITLTSCVENVDRTDVLGVSDVKVISSQALSEFRWLASNELDLLRENRTPADLAVYRIVKQGLERHRRGPAPTGEHG